MARVIRETPNKAEQHSNMDNAMDLAGANRPPGMEETITGAKDTQGGQLAPLVNTSRVTRTGQGPTVARFVPSSLVDVNGDDVEKIEPPVRKKFRVTKGGMTHTQAGLPSMVRVGKILDNVAFDIEALKAQGIELETIE